MIKKLLLFMMLCVSTVVGAWGQAVERNLVGNESTVFSEANGNLAAFCIQPGNAKVAYMQQGDKIKVYSSNTDQYTNGFGLSTIDGYTNYIDNQSYSGREPGSVNVYEINLDETNLNRLKTGGLKVSWNQNTNFIRITFISSSVPADVIATGIEFVAGTPTSVALGGNLDLTSYVKFTPENTTEKALTWTSSSDKATVVNGVVTGVTATEGEEKVRITATTTDGSNKSAYVDLIVKQGYSLTLATDPTSVINNITRTVTINPTVKVDETVQEAGTYSISYSLVDNEDDKVTIVGNVVTVAKDATAGTITVKAEVGENATYAGTSATTTFTIENAPRIIWPELTLVGGVSSMVVGSSTGIASPHIEVGNSNYVVDGKGTTVSAEITYTAEAIDGADNVSILKNPSNAKWFHISPVKVGTATIKITASATYNGVDISDSQTAVVNVTGVPLNFTMPDNLTINDDQPLTLEAIKAAITRVYTDINAIQTDIDAANYEVEIYKDEVKLDADIPAQGSEVNEFGITVKVKTKNSEYVDATPKDVTVTVTHLQSFTLTLDKTNATVKVGEIATITPSSDVSVEYSATSSNEGVATAEVDGGVIKVTGVSDGNAIITVTATPTGASASSYAVMKKTVNITVNSKTDGTVTTSISEDGKTLTITCSGDVCNPDQPYSAQGYKFTAAAKDVVYSNQEGQKVAQGEIYNGGDYYTRVTDYNIDNDVPTINVEAKRFVQGAVDAGIYKVNWNSDPTGYDLVSVGDKLDETYDWIDNGNVSKYYTREAVYNYTAIADMSSYLDTEDDTKFKSDLAENLVFSDQNGTAVTAGSEYTSGTYYTREATGNYTYSHVELNTLKTSAYTETFTEPKLNIGTAEYYVEEAGNKVRVYNGADYDEDKTYYIATSDYSKILNITETEYLESATVANSFWEAMVNDINANGYKTVVFKSGSEKGIICNHVTQAMMYLTSTRVLDMAGVAISSINAPFKEVGMVNVNQDASGNNLGTFMRGTNGRESNECIETLYTPQVTDEHFELGVASFIYLPKLRYLHLSEGIETLGEASIFARSFHLSQITFPNSLKVIKTNAVSGHFNASNHNGLTDLDGNVIPYIETLTLPPHLEVIETAAFAGTCPKDVYFLGRTAPKVARFAWGDDAYISNNAYELDLEAANSGIGVEVHMDKGEASRMNYLAQSGFLAMLHYPADCTEAEAAKYTDPTRNYRRVTYNTYSETGGVDPNDPTMTYDGTKYTWYTPGKETEAIKGFGHATGGAALKAFGNEYPWPSGSFTEEAWPQGYYGGDYAGGFYDVTKHGQYLWPSLVMAYRATVVAQNALTWDGIHTIGDIIRAKGETSFEGDGSEYEGLHQFVLAASDGNAESTTEWDMDKYMDGKWHTVCLPFNMTKKQMKETWGPVRLEGDEPVYSIRLCEFSAVERGNDLITLKFNTEKFTTTVNDDDIVLRAHISYMIKAEKDPAVEHITFKRYNIEPGAPKVTEIESTGTKREGTYRFIGNYVKVSAVTGQTVKMPQYTYFFSKTTGGFRFQVGTTGVWNPYSSVVEVPKGLDDYNSYFTASTNTETNTSKVATKFWGDIEDYIPTGVDLLMESNGEIIYTNSDVYNLSGQKVGNSIEGLPAGIYVVKGKKYLVK